MSADGVPVVIHDDTLERVQGRPERVRDLSASALEDLGVPTLAAVLAAVPRRAFLDVELKEDPDRAVVEVLAAGRGAELHGAVVSTFHPDRAGADRRPGADVAALAQQRRPGALDHRCRPGVRLPGRRRRLAGDRRRECGRVRAAGLDLIAWTVRRRSDVRTTRTARGRGRLRGGRGPRRMSVAARAADDLPQAGPRSSGPSDLSADPARDGRVTVWTPSRLPPGPCPRPIGSRPSTATRPRPASPTR